MDVCLYSIGLKILLRSRVFTATLPKIFYKVVFVRQCLQIFSTGACLYDTEPNNFLRHHCTTNKSQNFFWRGVCFSEAVGGEVVSPKHLPLNPPNDPGMLCGEVGRLPQYAVKTRPERCKLSFCQMVRVGRFGWLMHLIVETAIFIPICQGKTVATYDPLAEKDNSAFWVL